MQESISIILNFEELESFNSSFYIKNNMKINIIDNYAYYDNIEKRFVK